MPLLRCVRFVLLALALLLGSLAPPALAQNADARIIVPDVPGGALLAGCYSITQRLYGPYRMQFCLEQRGSYSVTGGGVACNGRLNWSARGRDLRIDLRRATCGNGVAWSADHMECRGAGLFAGIIARIFAPNSKVIGALRCTYTPAAGHQSPVTVTARRVN